MQYGETSVRLGLRPQLRRIFTNFKTQRVRVWDHATTMWQDHHVDAPLFVSEDSRHTLLVRLPSVERCVDFENALARAQQDIIPIPPSPPRPRAPLATSGESQAKSDSVSRLPSSSRTSKDVAKTSMLRRRQDRVSPSASTSRACPSHMAPSASTSRRSSQIDSSTMAIRSASASTRQRATDIGLAQAAVPTADGPASRTADVPSRKGKERARD